MEGADWESTVSETGLAGFDAARDTDRPEVLDPAAFPDLVPDLVTDLLPEPLTDLVPDLDADLDTALAGDLAGSGTSIPAG